MLELDKNYWLYIKPVVYCFYKGKQAVLYNTVNGEYIEIDSEPIIQLLQQLHEKQNLGVICCSGKMLMQSCYVDFVSAFCCKEMGDIVEVSKLPDKPIQLMPILNLQHDMDRVSKVNMRNIGEDTLRYLLELNIYLLDECNLNCRNCSIYARQVLCCQSSVDDTRVSLDISTLKQILRQIEHGIVGRLNLLGGNYPFMNELERLLVNFNGRVHIWNHYENFVNTSNLNSAFVYDIIVTFPFIEQKFESALLMLQNLSVNVHFYITQADEYEQCMELIKKYKIRYYSLHPIYIETNITFFEEYIYLEKEDILNSQSSLNNIFIHQKLNSNFFGSLTILVNGNVYANLNREVLGNIVDDKLIDMVNKELFVNTAWRNIRNNVPCSNCIYQFLCPSPSNYELVIGKYNLCHVKNADN